MDITMPPKIAAAIVAIEGKIKQLGTDESNKHGGYAYVSVDKFYERVGKMMADAGLALLINETEADVRTSERTDERGATKTVSWLFVRYELSFMHESGAMSASLRRSCALPISGPQAFGAAQSYIEKQFLRQVFKIPTGEKDADEIAQSEGAPGARRPSTMPSNTDASRPITDAQRVELNRLADIAGADKCKFCEYLGVNSFAEIVAADYGRAHAALSAKLAKAQKRAEPPMTAGEMA